MIEVVWTILQEKDHFLLAQRSYDDKYGGTWTFPGGKTDPQDIDAVATAHRELKEEVGLDGKRFRQLFYMDMDKYHIQIFMCDRWDGKPKPLCEDIIGVGWFTIPEMHNMQNILAPFASNSLLYLSYVLQHYEHHPDEWIEPWRGM